MLHEERYRTAAARHRDVTIDLETTRLAVADLDCFYKALDRSLMEFHSIKMREINDVLKDLWQATYRGKDIDTIGMRSCRRVALPAPLTALPCPTAIRSDSADGVADVGGPRKQYNYRLVMMQVGRVVVVVPALSDTCGARRATPSWACEGGPAPGSACWRRC